MPRIDPKIRLSVIPVIAAFSALFLVLPSKGAGREVTMIGRDGRYSFTPRQVTIEAGGAVTFSNESDVTHTGSCDGCPWDTGDIQPGMIKTLTFSAPGSYTFFCRYHGVSQEMVGSLEVRPKGAGTAPSPSPPPTAPSPNAPAGAP